MGSHRSVGREIWSNKLAVVISNDRMNGSAGVVQIVYLTTSTNKRPSRLHVRIDLPADEDVPFAIALCEQVHTVDKTRLTTFCGTVDAEQMKNLEEAVSWSLGIHDNEN